MPAALATRADRRVVRRRSGGGSRRSLGPLERRGPQVHGVPEGASRGDLGAGNRRRLAGGRRRLDPLSSSTREPLGRPPAARRARRFVAARNDHGFRRRRPPAPAPPLGRRPRGRPPPRGARASSGRRRGGRIGTLTDIHERVAIQDKLSDAWRSPAAATHHGARIRPSSTSPARATRPRPCRRSSGEGPVGALRRCWSLLTRVGSSRSRAFSRRGFASEARPPRPRRLRHPPRPSYARSFSSAPRRQVDHVDQRVGDSSTVACSFLSPRARCGSFGVSRRLNTFSTFWTCVGSPRGD
jgi:hypothetical protein